MSSQPLLGTTLVQHRQEAGEVAGRGKGSPKGRRLVKRKEIDKPESKKELNTGQEKNDCFVLF